MSARNKFATKTNFVVSSAEFCQCSFDERQIRGKCQQKNVWLFVHVLNIECAPNFGKTLLTYMLYAIMHMKSPEESSILLILYRFWLYL